MHEQGHQARPTISVVIVSYNTRAMTLACLQSLYADLRDLPAEVFVVDNASNDGTVAAIAEAYPAVRLIANDQNVGFGAANNQAMRQAGGEFLLLLNSDAFPEPGATAALLAYLRANPNLAAAGPRLLNADGSLQVSCFPFPSPWRAWAENLWLPRLAPPASALGDFRRWAHDAARPVDWVVGACLMVRRSVYEQIGGFDERFFMYAEESDWQRRMRDAGWAIGFTPDARVKHLGGASGAAERPKINRHFFQSLDRYELKHHGLAGLIAMRGAMVVGSLLRLAGWTGVLVARPKRRPLARAKVRLLSWLFVRQATHWRLAERGRAR